MSAVQHYDKNYFDWQKSIGAFGGEANKVKFQEYIRPTDRVVDFGCGGGFLLSRLECGEKLGIEINPAARENAKGLGIRAVENAALVPNEWADVIISNHALEHVEEPLVELRKLYEKLKPGGKLVIVVPSDSIKMAYDPKDINQHLFSWSPMNLGHLLTQAGFQVLESKPYYHKWFPRYQTVVRVLGWNTFHFLSKMYSRWEDSWFQVRAVAIKK